MEKVCEAVESQIGVIEFVFVLRSQVFLRQAIRSRGGMISVVSSLLPPLISPPLPLPPDQRCSRHWLPLLSSVVRSRNRLRSLRSDSSTTTWCVPPLARSLAQSPPPHSLTADLASQRQPYQADTDTGVRGGQYGYNRSVICRSTRGGRRRPFPGKLGSPKSKFLAIPLPSSLTRSIRRVY